jgi:acetyl-CoA carboxylase biotin carboxylase subunit
VPQIKKLLVANRGEIAVRIIRACQELGIKTVALYSDADKESLHVRMADQAICIGPPLPARSYLNMSTILSACRATKADAIHPGYGFLAENAEFSEACSQNHIRFVGPSGDVIRKLGNKIAAREAAVAVSIPIVPGKKECARNLEEVIAVAETIGYPLLLKAAAGGGGRGIQLVHNERNLGDAFLRAQAEAQTAFGDGTLYVEKLIKNARHVEVQVLLDEHGNGIHLGERDCSIQRRHQKLLEESPCIVIDDGLRNDLTQASLAFARSVGYSSAGTVEFIFDQDEKRFYFMEMNTRIQVEHPVTEMLTGVDIIKEQIRIAAGETLSLSQEQIASRGHAIECRINAEDPENNFSPNPGTITKIVFPGGPGVRTDSHCYSGYTISPFYDSLLAKLIVIDRNRQDTICRMERVLKEFEVQGIATTIPFHLEVLQHSRFLSGNYNTRWIEESFLRRENKSSMDEHLTDP